MMGGGILRRLRAGGLTFALFALTLKAMLPPGFMLGADASGRIAVTLCGGEQGAVLDLSTGTLIPHQGEAPADANGALDCPFALAAAPALPEVAVEPAAPRLAFIATAPTPLALAPAAPPTGPPLPARGPPSHV